MFKIIFNNIDCSEKSKPTKQLTLFFQVFLSWCLESKKIYYKMIKSLDQSPHNLNGEKGKARYKNDLEGTISVS